MEIDAVVDVGFEIICDGCGLSLGVARESISGTTITLKIEPCSKCLEKERDRGYDDGVSESRD